MRTVLIATILGATLVAVAAGCGGSSGSSSGTTSGSPASSSSSGMPIKTIDVKETEFKLDPSTINLDQAGTYTFKAVNDGSYGHALEIEGKGVEAKTSTIDGGGSQRLTVTLAPGTYEIYCPVANHRAMGMEGTLVVAGGSGSGGMTTTDSGGGTTTDDSSSSGGGYGY